MRGILQLALVVLMAWAGPALAFDQQAVPPEKRTTLGLYLAAEEVPPFLALTNGRALFLDVRTPAELAAVGMPAMADANVPLLIERPDGGVTVNDGFVSGAVRALTAKGLTKADPVVVICRSGGRSAKAADVLASAGFTRVYSVVDGFEGDVAREGPRAGKRVVNGWKNKGLPWKYPDGRKP